MGRKNTGTQRTTMSVRNDIRNKLDVLYTEDKNTNKTQHNAFSKWADYHLFIPVLEISEETGLSMVELLAVVKSDNFKNIIKNKAA